MCNYCVSGVLIKSLFCFCSSRFCVIDRWNRNSHYAQSKKKRERERHVVLNSTLRRLSLVSWSSRLTSWRYLLPLNQRILHGAFRAAGERATCRNVGHGDISGIRKVRNTLRSASNWRSVWGRVFYLFIIPVTLKHADISSTCRNECKIRSLTHSACGNVETRVDILKGNP